MRAKLAAVVAMIDDSPMERAELLESLTVQASSLLGELAALRLETAALRHELDAWTVDGPCDDDERPTIPVRPTDTMPCCA